VPSVLFAFELNFLINYYPMHSALVANVAEVSMREFFNHSYVMSGHPAGIAPTTEKWICV